jgi:predicted Holliday junction resolvase-like endonuclease
MGYAVLLFMGIVIGIFIGGFSVYVISRGSREKRALSTVQAYEKRIQVLKERHQEDLKRARNRSIDGSRAVIKGEVAEQFAPILPNFKYLPSDARFLGDPIDYIVFNGYTNLKDDGGDENNLEVVIIDIKTGSATLSKLQQAIATAIHHGRVRFEVIYPEISPPSHSPQPSNRENFGGTPQTTTHNLSNLPRPHSSRPHSSRPTFDRIQEIRKTHARAYMAWSKDEEDRLRQRYNQGVTIHKLTQEFQRQPGGIRARLKKLGLLE